MNRPADESRISVRPAPSALPAGALPELPELVAWMARRVKVLELGSGGGVDALWLAEQGYLATVVEPSTERARRLRHLAGTRGLALRVVTRHLASSRFSARYDIVVARARGRAATDQEVETLVRRMQESTRRGGFNVIALELELAGSSGTPSVAGEGPIDAVLATYHGWRLLGQRRYRPMDGSDSRTEIVRITAQRPA